MNLQTKLSGIFILLNLFACSSQPSLNTQDSKAVSAPTSTVTETQPNVQTPPPITNQGLAQQGQNPPMTLQHGKKKLGLVRIMDGGVCKNTQQGVKGSFLIYADLEAIKHIKSTKGDQIFIEFETKIQRFSSQSLQDAVDATNLSVDPFVTDNNEAQEKLAKQLSANFQKAITKALKGFQKETGLTLDVVPFQPTFVFFQDNCDKSIMDQDTNTDPFTSNQ